ncbi:unnamed protein product [Blumeria hordei]|uniref:Ubiquitin-like domain-containing protein n=2 Tax=Blumeria hordei TaxID=2867405 RepID=A0A383USH9_BLUHO|nr:hypothetical protein BGHDH14_bgh05509 [Blumeria hordei DH14]SZF03314.1 unnamed protein product [Blumeria hordei]
MTELSFAKSFLTSLESRPTKLSADHVENPKCYTSRPVFNPPKHTGPLLKKRKVTPGAASNLTIRIKSQRNLPLDIKLPTQPPTSTIRDIKEHISNQTSIPVGKIKLLLNKKPVADNRILKDLVNARNDEVCKNGEDHNSLELSVMVLGGASSLIEKESHGLNAAGQDNSTDSARAFNSCPEKSDLIKTNEFWSDLRSYLSTQLQDEAEGERVCQIFRAAILEK